MVETYLIGGKPILRLLISISIALGLGVGSAAAAAWNKLVAPAELSELIGSGQVVILDIRGPEDYAAGHIAGALNAPYASWRGPKGNPGRELTNEQLTERLQSLGVKPGSQVAVTYQGKDTTGFGAAARVYWTLKSAGLAKIAILNGGISSWTAAGQALDSEPVAAVRSNASFTLSDEWLITREGVQNALDGARQSTMIDARTAAFWAGKKKHPAAQWQTSNKTKDKSPGCAKGVVGLPSSQVDWQFGCLLDLLHDEAG